MCLKFYLFRFRFDVKNINPITNGNSSTLTDSSPMVVVKTLGPLLSKELNHHQCNQRSETVLSHSVCELKHMKNIHVVLN